MSEYLPSFIVEPVLRQARRFSRFSSDEAPTNVTETGTVIDGHTTSPDRANGITTSIPEDYIAGPSSPASPIPGTLRYAQTVPTSPIHAAPVGIAAGYLPAVPDFQRFYPSRFWNNASPPPTAASEDEQAEGTWQSLARNIQLWANQINNLDVIPSPPLDPMRDTIVDNAAHVNGSMSRPGLPVVPSTDTLEFPPLPTEPIERVPETTRPNLEEHRNISETSLNPAEELSFRARVFSDAQRIHSSSDPVHHPGTLEPARRDSSMDVDQDLPRRRDGSGALPEDDGMSAMRQRISAIMSGPGTAGEKSRLIHLLMNERHKRAGTPASIPGKEHVTKSNVPMARPYSPLSLISTRSPQPVFSLTATDLRPTYAPPEIDEDGTHHPPELGCIHYKRNIKMQCATCEAWHTCRLCHDEVEDHVLPRRDTRYMLCMLCHTPQPVGQICRSCNKESACYYCPICKLWNNDPEKSIYHCDDCGICRLGKGLGKDFFHCTTCAACMSIEAETTHKCIEKSTRCDCPICGEYMFTSNKPVAFMRCGHSIHEKCFSEWCSTSYKCPICSRSITNMEAQFRRLDRHIEEQPMPEEYASNRAFVFCNDCNSRSTTRYHWLGLKCSICESYNTTQLELLGPEQTPQQIREQTERAHSYGMGEAALTASQSTIQLSALTSPVVTPGSRPPSVPLDGSRPVPIARRQDTSSDFARSPPQNHGSPYLLPHSPTRSARSVTPVVGSYFGTGASQHVGQPLVDDNRRNSFFSIFSAGQPRSPDSSELPPSRLRSSTNGEIHNEDSDEDMDPWGGSVRSGGRGRTRDEDMVDVADTIEADDLESASSSSDDEIDDDDDEEEGDVMDLLGHR